MPATGHGPLPRCHPSSPNSGDHLHTPHTLRIVSIHLLPLRHDSVAPMLPLLLPSCHFQGHICNQKSLITQYLLCTHLHPAGQRISCCNACQVGGSAFLRSHFRSLWAPDAIDGEKRGSRRSNCSSPGESIRRWLRREGWGNGVTKVIFELQLMS